MGRNVGIVGVGQTDHASSRNDVNDRELINEAVRRALDNAELEREEIDAILIGNMDHFESINYVDTYSVDGSGGLMKPVMKLTTGGTTGSTIGINAYYHVASGIYDKVLAIGWEKNSESDTQAAIATCSNPWLERDHFAGAIGPLASIASNYMDKHGATEEDFAIQSVREHKNGLNNPHAHLQMDITVEDVMNSEMISHPIKRLDMCPTSDGACAVVFASEEEAKKMTDSPAWVHACSTRHNYTHIGDPPLDKHPTLGQAAKDAYEKAGITDPREEFDVMELYTPNSSAGVMWVEDLGICERGESPKLNREGVYDMDGELPINPSGGVLCTNAIGATGLIRIGEAALQIMGEAGERQVPDVSKALATGFGGCWWSDVMVLGESLR